MSLVSLAEQGNLPQFQFIDKDTLCWIRKNKPSFQPVSIGKRFLPLIKSDTLRFTPSRLWFLRKEGIDSIHGIRHTMRVIANLSYLLQENKIIDQLLMRKVFIAASLHDLRRKNDKGDQGHAKRAADWFSSNTKEILRFFKVGLGKKDVKDVTNAILLHESPYSQFRGQCTYKASREVVDLLKSADALDRYRLPKLKWWIDDNYLALIPSDKAKKFAYTLVLSSESLFLKTNESIKSILMTFDKVKS